MFLSCLWFAWRLPSTRWAGVSSDLPTSRGRLFRDMDTDGSGTIDFQAPHTTRRVSSIPLLDAEMLFPWGARSPCRNSAKGWASRRWTTPPPPPESGALRCHLESMTTGHATSARSVASRWLIPSRSATRVCSKGTWAPFAPLSLSVTPLRSFLLEGLWRPAPPRDHGASL